MAEARCELVGAEGFGSDSEQESRSEDVGAEPPPTSDSPGIIVVFKSRPH